MEARRAGTINGAPSALSLDFDFLTTPLRAWLLNIGSSSLAVAGIAACDSSVTVH